jgi:antitoxin MazE
MASASIGVDQRVDVREEGGRIVMDPVRAPSYELDERLDRMHPETFPEDIDFGPPNGGEVW